MVWTDFIPTLAVCAPLATGAVAAFHHLASKVAVHDALIPRIESKINEVANTGIRVEAKVDTLIMKGF